MAVLSPINNKVAQVVAVLFLSVSFLVCGRVDAATIQITSNSAVLSPGSITTLSVLLDSEGIAINNAEAKIVFPTDLLEVVSISKGNSIFSLWVEEPAYSNITGMISFNGGIPTPGFNGSNGTAISIVVKAKKAGQVDVVFSDAAVRANDGLGTDVLRIKTGRTFTVVNSEPSATSETPIDVQSPTITALQVTSPTHPSQELWYRDNSPIFRWKVGEGVDTIQTGIDNNTGGSPRVTFTPAISERTVKDLKDGIWYFKVRARKDGEWSPVSTYIARVDNTIPQKNEVEFSYDDINKVLNIRTDIIDETSGLDYYEIFINDALIKKIPSAEFVDGAFSLGVDSPGENNVKLVAVDRAGNSVQSSGSFKATAVIEPVPQSVTFTNEPSLITIGSLTVPAPAFFIFIISIGVVLIIGAFILGRRYNKVQNKFRVPVAYIKGDNTKVLLLLKKRLEKHLEILQHTRHNRMLSKGEKEIKEAIEGDLDEIDRAIEEQEV